MNEKAFYSNNFALKCPVWLIVDQEAFNLKGIGATMKFAGEPGLGQFLPIFLTARAAGAFCKGRYEKKFSAVEINTPEDLRKTLLLSETKNVAIYLRQEKTRFYRIEDLLEELKSHLQN